MQKKFTQQLNQDIPNNFTVIINTNLPLNYKYTITIHTVIQLLIETLFYNSPHNQKYVIVIDFSFPYLYGQSAVVEKSRYLQEGRLQPSTISLH